MSWFSLADFIAQAAADVSSVVLFSIV